MRESAEKRKKSKKKMREQGREHEGGKKSVLKIIEGVVHLTESTFWWLTWRETVIPSVLSLKNYME